MIEKQACARIEAPNRFHIPILKLETKNVEVLGHPLPTHRFRDNDDSSLYVPDGRPGLTFSKHLSISLASVISCPSDSV